jgi:hypothetical protein
MPEGSKGEGMERRLVREGRFEKPTAATDADAGCGEPGAGREIRKNPLLEGVLARRGVAAEGRDRCGAGEVEIDYVDPVLEKPAGRRSEGAKWCYFDSVFERAVYLVFDFPPGSTRA